jgi:hypothetical protein
MVYPLTMCNKVTIPATFSHLLLLECAKYRLSTKSPFVLMVLQLVSLQQQLRCMSQYSRDSDSVTCPVCSLYNRASCFGNVPMWTTTILSSPYQIALRQLKSATFESIGSWLSFCTLLEILQCLDSRKEHLPQFRNSCFVVPMFLLLWLTWFNISRNISSL